MFLKEFPIFLYRYFLCCTLALLLMGCSTTTKPDGVKNVQQQLGETYPNTLLPLESQDHSTTIKALLEQPLTPQSALQIMLLNSPQIESKLTQLSAADAIQLQASLVRNPRLSLSLLKQEGGNPWLWDFGITQTLLEFLTRNQREQQAAGEAATIQFDVISYVQSTINKLQQVYFQTLATQHQMHIQQTLLDVATAKKELAESLFKAGNISEAIYLKYLADEQQQEHVLAAQTAEMLNNKSELNYLLGFTDVTFELPKNLPDVPNEHFDTHALIAEAIDRHIDIQQIQQHQRMLNAQLTIVKKEYGLADSNLGIEAKKENDGVRSIGPKAEINLPILDNGNAKAAIINAQIHESNAQLKDVRLRITRDINQAMTTLISDRAHITHLNDMQSIAERRVELAQREVNFMLSSPFDLIDLKAEAIQFQQEKNGILLSYWQARSALELALGRQIPIDAPQQEPLPLKIDEHAHHHMGNETEHSGVHKHD